MMYLYKIKGGNPLEGTVKLSGAKNAALPILAATLLTDDKCVLENVPDLMDVRTMMNLLRILGKDVMYENNTATITTRETGLIEAPYEVVKTMRASICVLGPLLAKNGKAKVSLPGGCAIGPRPVDLHLRGMEELGAEIEISHGYIEAKAGKLQGTEIYLAGKYGPTVLGTDNVMSAAALAQGTTVIESAAMEPETQDLAQFLIQMGADIEGAGTSRISIKGVEKLHGTNYKIISDRIEAGTFIAMVGMTGGRIILDGINEEHCKGTIRVFKEMGLKFNKIDNDKIEVISNRNEIKTTTVETRPYPGFATDMQPQLTSVISVAQGRGVVTELIYPDRFTHVQELMRMGANIKLEPPSIVIEGTSTLEGAEVMASDLRGGAALVIAGLGSSNTTIVRRIYHIDRGYEKFEEKISSIGGNIVRQPQ